MRSQLTLLWTPVIYHQISQALWYSKFIVGIEIQIILHPFNTPPNTLIVMRHILTIITPVWTYYVLQKGMGASVNFLKQMWPITNYWDHILSFTLYEVSVINRHNLNIQKNEASWVLAKNTKFQYFIWLSLPLGGCAKSSFSTLMFLFICGVIDFSNSTVCIASKWLM